MRTKQYHCPAELEEGIQEKQETCGIRIRFLLTSNQKLRKWGRGLWRGMGGRWDRRWGRGKGGRWERRWGEGDGREEEGMYM